MGRLGVLSVDRDRDEQIRFWSKVDFDGPDGCWLWRATLDTAGYGRFRAAEARSMVSAHRRAYMRLVGPIPEGLVLDHLCRVRNCVNPAHLEPVTHEENCRRGENAQRDKTHCPQGHPYDEANTYIYPSDGRRACRRCHREAVRRSRELVRADR